MRWFVLLWVLVASSAVAQDQAAPDPTGEVAAEAAEAVEEALEATERAIEAQAEAVDAAQEAEVASEQAAEATEEAQAAVAEAEATGAVVEDVAAIDWTGTWRSFWRGGQALLILEQEGTAISGTYQPGDGKIEGAVEGVVVTGTWSQPGAEGGFEFALAPDGQSFVGRYANGEYWNGQRLDDAATDAAGFGAGSPRETLLSLMSAANAAADGDSFAEFMMRRHLAFPDADAALRERNARIAKLVRLLDISTFRISAAPEVGEAGVASFEVGPAGVAWTFPVEFAETRPGFWQVVVPPEDTLDALTADALAALEVEDFDALAETRRYNPRQAGRDFMRGTANWNDGGDELALSTLDLSGIPEHLRATDGPLAAEYIRQIIDRAGYSIWQEVPDDPDRRRPYVVYEHALGAIEMAPVAQEDGTTRWLFTADSLARGPAIYEAMQNLPPAEGVTPNPPLTRAFALRQELKEISPRLLQRTVLLENWQWVAIAAILIASVLGSYLLVWLGRVASISLMRLGNSSPETREATAAAFRWPARVFTAGAILTVLLREIALRPEVSAIGNGFATLFMLAGGTFFLYRLVNAATVSLSQAALQTATDIDDIAVGIGGGFAKIVVLVGGVMLAADVLGLPYEGVIAGLGVGGLALAMAAQHWVANFLGAGILMADRQFKKGDLIEGGGHKGVVQHVGLRSTQLRTEDGAMVTVPNSALTQDKINNWGPPRAGMPHAFRTSFAVAIDAPREKLDAFVGRLGEIFAAQPGAQPGATAALAGIVDGAFEVELSGSFEAPTDMGAARHRLLGDVVDAARQIGIGFAGPASRTGNAGMVPGAVAAA